MSEMDDEELAWLQTPAYELWALDKLILARTMGYICGPVGMDVPRPGWYIVRPCVNILGLGLGAEKVWLEKSTDHLSLGYFWCEWFEGKHHSVDYKYGNQVLAVRGHRSSDILTKWDKWEKVTQDFSIPPKLHMLKSKRWLNIEFIGDEVIEVHYRNNPDFEFNNKEFIPVWRGQDTNPPEGYSYIEHPDIHGRIGGFIR